VFEQVPVFLHGIVVVTREEGVVVDRVGLAARLPCLVEERGPAETRAALDERHVVTLPPRSRRSPRRLFSRPLLSRHGRPKPSFHRERRAAIVDACIKDSIDGVIRFVFRLSWSGLTRRGWPRRSTWVATRSSSHTR